MKKIIIASLIINSIFLFKSEILAQDIHFSQFRETPILVNPAQTALGRDLRVISNYKTQWSSVGSPYKTQALSFELLLNKNNRKKGQIGLGVQVINDKAGDGKLSTTQALLSMSGIIKVSKFNKISTGLIAGFGQRSINYSSLKWDQQYNGNSYDASLSSGEAQAGVLSYSYPDMGAGVCWSYGSDEKHLYSLQNNGFKAKLGVSAWHFGVPNYSFSQQYGDKLYSKVIAHGNLELTSSGAQIKFIPEFLFVTQGKLNELNIGCLVKYLLKQGSQITGRIDGCALSLGANYRYKDAVVISSLIEYGNMAVGLSYDINTSRLRSASSMMGGFEIALRFVTPNPFSAGKARF